MVLAVTTGPHIAAMADHQGLEAVAHPEVQEAAVA